MKLKGFSLLEMALALGVSGVMLGGIWQTMTSASQQAAARQLSSQAVAVAQAGQSFLNVYRTSILPLVPTINSAVRIKITSTDTGTASVTDIRSAGQLAADFVNENSYGQSYAFYAQRVDAGPAGADENDRLVGLLITTGGQSIPDKTGTMIATLTGSAGGFLYRDANPAPPTAATTARGTGSGWSVDLSTAPWSSVVSSTAQAGRIAILTNLLANSGNLGLSMTNAVPGIDSLTDGITDYVTDYTVFLGDSAGIANTTGSSGTALGYMALSSNLTGNYNTAIGRNALANNTANHNGTAFGAFALRMSRGDSNTAFGAFALGYPATAMTGTLNTAAGTNALLGNVTGNNNTALGHISLTVNTASNNTAAGSASLRAVTSGANNTAFGTYSLVGNITGSHNTASGYNSAAGITGSNITAFGTNAARSMIAPTDITAFGYNALIGTGTGCAASTTAFGYTALSTASNSCTVSNTGIGYQVGFGITSGTNNTMLGANALGATVAAASNHVAVGYNAAFNSRDTNSTIAIGYEALMTQTTGYHNTAVGYRAMAGSGSVSTATTGYYNVGVGVSALSALRTGTNNIAVGSSALTASQVGVENVAIGSSALTASISDNNVAIGHQALVSLTNAGNNIAIGYYAQAGNQTNANVVSIGYEASRYFNNASNPVAVGSLAGGTATGGGNVYFGHNSGSASAITPLSSVAIGYETLAGVVSQINNTAVGSQAMRSVRTDGNTAVGARSLYTSSTGGTGNNSAIGTETLYSLTTGSRNSVAGHHAGRNITTGTSNTAAGYMALFTGGNTTGRNVAIGSNALYSNAANHNTGIGYSAMRTNSSGTNNTAVGFAAMWNNTSGSNNTAIGCNYVTINCVADMATGALDNSTAIGWYVTASNEIRLGNTFITQISGAVPWSFPSDRRDKHDIRDTDLGLEFIMKLRPVSYTLRNGNGRTDYGFIAQEIEQALDGRETNMIFVKSDERKSYIFRSSDLLSPVVKATQQQEALLRQQTDEISALEQKLQTLARQREDLLHQTTLQSEEISRLATRLEQAR